jgi:hypothetical protein
MDAMMLPPLTCNCDNRLAAVEAELRAKAKRHPDSAVAYSQAALEIARVRRSHWGDCATCQAIEDQLASAQGPATAAKGAAHA